MKRIMTTIVSLGLTLAAMISPVGAQTTTEEVTATDGDAAAMGTGNVSAEPGTVTRGDSSGTSVLGPDGTYNVVEVAPPSINVTGDTEVLAPAPEAAVEPVYTEPVAEEPVYTEPVAEDTAVATDTAVASEGDLDADNIADALEWELGLDPNVADVDGDGVADGDELTIYGTDALVWDTDGDGIADGEELFGIQTDPLVWDTDGNGVVDGGEVAVSGTDSVDSGVALQ